MKELSGFSSVVKFYFIFDNSPSVEFLFEMFKVQSIISFKTFFVKIVSICFIIIRISLNFYF